MKNRYVAAIAGVCLLAGASGAYLYTAQHDPAPHIRTVAVGVPLDPAARDLAAYKGKASAKNAARHARATAARQAAARRAAQGGYEPATAPQDNGRTPRTAVGQPCDGDPGSYHVTQPDGTCSGPVHYGPNHGLTVTGPNDPNWTTACPSGAATNAYCGRKAYGNGPTSGEKQMQYACKHGYADPKDC